MRVAIVDHSFHQRTGSSAFFIEILERFAAVSVFWDESWKTGLVDPEVVKSLVDEQFDKIIFYQVFWPSSLLESLGIHKALYVPMYDDVRKKGSEWWQGYEGSYFISFSRALDDQLDRVAGDCLHVQYFPEPVDSTEPHEGGLIGFFWQRNKALQWNTIWSVASGNEWSRFNLHWVPDPGEKTAARPSENFCRKHSICLSDWFDDLDDFHELMASADVYFAPRLYEGIGMGFLEAMAHGQCVVAPDSATHNEYIDSGVNGILYDPESPEPVLLKDARVLGDAARESCREGHVRWKQHEEEICAFVKASPCEVDYDLTRKVLLEVSNTNKIWRTRGSIFERAGRKLLRVLRNP